MTRKIKTTIIQDAESFKAYEAFVRANDILAFDIETSGVNSRSDVVMGLGVSNGEEGFYLPLRFYDKIIGKIGVYPYAQVVQPLFLKALEGKKLIAWGGSFEALFCKNQLGWNFVEHFHADGMLMLHLADENRFNYGLKETAAADFGAWTGAAQDAMLESVEANGGSGKEYYKSDTDKLGIYCIWDCVLTFWHYERLVLRLKQERLDKFFFEDETMPFLKNVVIPMEDVGVPLDLELLKSTQAELGAEIERIEASIQAQIAPNLPKFIDWFLNKDYPPKRTGPFAQTFAEMHNLPLPKTKAGKLSMTEKALEALPDSHARSVLLQEAYMTEAEIRRVQVLLWAQEGREYMFNLSSKHHLKKLFFEILEEQPLSKTDKGNPQVDEDFIVLMGKKYPWAELLRQYNKLMKIKGTYVDRLLEEQKDGVYHPQWFMHRTVTGRMSGDMQQLPRQLEPGQEAEVVVKYTNRIRQFLKAPEGWTFVGADYNSLEPRVFSHLSKDEALLDIFRKDLDFYSTICIQTEKLHQYSADKEASNYLGKVAKSKRQSAKAYALGIAYGEEDYKLHIELGISQEEAKRLVSGYWMGFPELHKVSESNKAFVCKNGYIRNEAGRIRHMPRAKELHAQYGKELMDSLGLWKKYHEMPALYDRMKKLRKEQKKYMNTSMNYPVQSLANSIISRAAVAIMKQFRAQGLQAVVCMAVHDELVSLVPDSEAEQVCAIMKQYMENTYKLDLPLTADPVCATIYSETK